MVLRLAKVCEIFEYSSYIVLEFIKNKMFETLLFEIVFQKLKQSSKSKNGIKKLNSRAEILMGQLI